MKNCKKLLASFLCLTCLFLSSGVFASQAPRQENKQVLLFKFDNGKVFYAAPEAEIKTSDGGSVKAKNVQPGTVYLNSDGSKQKVVEISAGEIVGDAGQDSKQVRPGIEADRVIDHWCKYVDSILEITFENGEKLGVTNEHPFMTAQHVWVPANKLVPGALLFARDGNIAVKSIREIKERTKVCGITTEKNHNYFVGESGFLVHNDCFPNGTVKSEGGEYLLDGDRIIDKSNSHELTPVEVFELSSHKDLQANVPNASLEDIRLSLMQSLTVDEMLSVGKYLESKYRSSSGLEHLSYLADRNRLISMYESNLRYKYKAIDLTEQQLQSMNGIMRNFKADATEKGRIVLGLLGNAFLLKTSGIVKPGSNPFKPLGLGSTGRASPANLLEDLAMKEVLSNPLDNALDITNRMQSGMSDPRWLGSNGWVKMQRVVPTSQGKITIHFNYNKQTGAFDDFKFK